MPWGIAAAVGAGSVASGIIGSNAAGKAAGQQVTGFNNASGTEQGFFDQAKGNIQPYVGAGQNALAQLQSLLGLGPGGSPQGSNPILQMLGLGGPGATGSINPSTFTGSPGYNYALQQGTNAVTNNAAANGGLGGNALRALQSTGQGIANQNFNQYLGTANTAWQQLLSNIGGISSQGLNAADSLGKMGLTTGSEIGGNDIGAGNAMAAGTMGSAQAIQGMIKGLVSAISSAGGGMGGAGGGGGGISSLFGGGGMTNDVGTWA